MTAIREFIKVKNHKIEYTLPEGFECDEVEMIIMPKHDKNLEQDPYFYERKAELEQLDRDIASGKEELINSDEFEAEMDIFVAELVQKYGN